MTNKDHTPVEKIRELYASVLVDYHKLLKSISEEIGKNKV